MASSNGVVNGEAGASQPRHVAIIMDGNGRWAKKRLLPRIEGHRRGAKTVRMVVEESRRLGIEYLTLFTFSSENWQRPVDEVGALMKLFDRYLRSEVDLMLENNIRLRAIGDRTRLPAKVLDALEEVEERTLHMDGMELLLAVSYGGRDELVAAAKGLAKRVQAGELSPDEIDQGQFESALYAPDVPDPDLLIRTSNENRISNFMLWQLAYSEIVVSPLLWPEFSKEAYHACLADYGNRNRRYGLTEDQLGAQEA